MPLMLPSVPATARSLVGVADDLLASLRADAGALPPVRSAVLVVIDGLGAIALRAHAGHARTLAAAMGRKDVAHTVFPTTTASGLTSLLTGVWPGEHGLVGYSVRHPERDVLLNQLKDWGSAGLDPFTWQSAPTVFERAAALGHPAFAVGVPKHANTGFTSAILRGAEFVPVADTRERVARAYALAVDHEGALVYCYLPGTDQTGHKHGMASAKWIAALEEIDAALAQPVPPGVGVLVTSDHGMVDVPAHRQLILDPGDACMDGVRHVGGEPRMLHVYLDDSADAAAAASRWQETLGEAANAGTKAEAIAGGLFGPRVTPDVAARIGDVLVAARGNRAVYPGIEAPGRGMIGQHGALTPEELQVPFLRFGAFAPGR